MLQYFIREASMIEEQIQTIKVEPAIIARAENVARKTYKVGNWLKLLSMHLQNENHDEIDNIVRKQIHENYIMQQGFWINEMKRKFNKANLTYEDIDYLLLAFEDGFYFKIALEITARALNQFSNDKKRLNFALSTMEKVVSRFTHVKSLGSSLFEILRETYQLSDNIKKTRECFERQIRQSFDSMDLTYDFYKLWQTQPQHLQRMKSIYNQARVRWEQQRIQFDQSKLSKINVRRSLSELQYSNTIDQNVFIQWLDLLPSEKQKLEYLRRRVLLHKQMIPYYLTKCQQFYTDPEVVVGKYKVAIRISENSQQIQEKYIGYLVRRINKHLIQNEKELDKEYYNQWGDNVAYFREEINALISKQRRFVGDAQQKKIFNQYYQIWIEVQQNIVKDKDMVCKLYENLVKDRKQQELGQYKAYARSLIQMNAFNDAKNVLKRYLLHSQYSQESKKEFLRFINIYGSIQDQLEYFNEQKSKAIKNTEIAPNKSTVVNAAQEQTIAVQSISESNKAEKQEREGEGLKRVREKDLDQVQQKIQSSIRKKAHVDGQNTVFMKGIPSDWTETDVIKSLKLQKNVTSVRLVVKNSIQKDYCYIQFDSKQAAQQQVKINEGGYKLYISRPPADYDQTKTLFLCALPTSATSDKISNLFSNHSHNIVDIRLKLDKDKNYAYVDFNTKESKESAYNQLHNETLLIDGKKILMQYCDSNRQKNKKFAQVIFLKGLSFKTENRDLQDFFKEKKIVNISLPKTPQGKGKGFGYVEFQKFKDYQQALDMRKGTIHGRQFQILKSDRQITQSNPQRNQQRQKSSEHKPNQHSKKPKNSSNNQKTQVVKDNSYFSSLFK